MKVKQVLWRASMLVPSVKLGNELITAWVALQYLSDIEDHLNVTIQQVEPDLKIPADEFDGKVVYGQKRRQMGTLKTALLI